MADFIGTAPGIQLIDPTKINVVAKAHFRKPLWDKCSCFECCYDLCCKADKRKYFYGLENGLESNHPVASYPCFEPNCCCPIFDNVSRLYFDTGFLWNKMDCLWGTGFYGGNGTFFANNRKYVCCCQECSEGWNGCFDGCYFTSICGDRLRFNYADKCCFCCDTTAGCCDNKCGICGLANGQPNFLLFVSVDVKSGTVAQPWQVMCLEQGTAEDFASKVNAARVAWSSRTGCA